MMQINYHFAMKDLDSKTIGKIAKKLYGENVKIFLEVQRQKRQVTLEELKNINLKDNKVTIENCDKTAVIKPAYVSLIQYEDRPEAYIKGPNYSVEIAADDKLALEARNTIEEILQN